MSDDSLRVALTGLRVAQQKISVISNNISNASTDGYSRKTLPQYSIVVAERGAGARTGNVQRVVSELLQRDYQRQISTTNSLETQQRYLDQIQTFLGPPSKNLSYAAEVSKLKDAFAQFANQPESLFQQNNTLNSAKQMAGKFNDTAKMLTQMRNDTQQEMTQSIDRINALAEQIKDLNNAIKSASVLERPTADLEDQRDLAIRKLAEDIDVTTFKGDNNVIAVMTRSGQTIADTAATKFYFSPEQIGPASAYPGSAAAVRLSDPVTGQDITGDTKIGGKLGALISLRDRELPQYNAQLDELAQKMAMRFDTQGLRLFTRADGQVPANTPVTYTGFASEIQVNPAIQTDNTLLRKGTNPNSSVALGSAEILRKVVQFTFGANEYQRGLGNTDISGATPLFTTLGLQAQAKVTGNKNIVSLGALDSSAFINPGTADQFTIQLGAGAPQTITINAGDTASNLVTSINTAFPGLASLGTGGQLVLNANQSITIGAGTILTAGLEELGLTAGVTAAQNPNFQIGIGKNAQQTVTILPTDTSTDLLNKLNAITGLTASLTVDGYLDIRPTEGADLALTDGLRQPLLALGVRINNVAHPPFNVTGLGANGNINGRIQGASSLLDYAQQAVSIQSQDAQNVENVLGAEDNYRASLEQEFKNTTGVNLDEEMTEMIAVQTAYSASAKAVQVAEQMLRELMDAMVR